MVAVDFVVVVLVRTRRMMVISRTLRTITLLARKRVKRTLKKRKIFAHLHTCNHLTADLDKINIGVTIGTIYNLVMLMRMNICVTIFVSPPA